MELQHNTAGGSNEGDVIGQSFITGDQEATGACRSAVFRLFPAGRLRGIEVATPLLGGCA